MENVGFHLEPEHSLEAWAYGNGFPKSLNVVKALAAHQVRGDPPDPESDEFRGYGTALKPAWEPFVVGRKP
jgi:site-specific DNA-methyltransferase (adenine-specific)